MRAGEEASTEGAALRRNARALWMLAALVVIVTANLNAIVDRFLHPEIPYFDEEHLIVGGVAAVVNAVLLATVASHVRALARASDRIRTLESFMAICMHCKKVRVPSSPEREMTSWQNIETYLWGRIDTRFTHGLCPECEVRHYPSEETPSGSSPSR